MNEHTIRGRLEETTLRIELDSGGHYLTAYQSGRQVSRTPLTEEQFERLNLEGNLDIGEKYRMSYDIKIVQI